VLENDGRMLRPVVLLHPHGTESSFGTESPFAGGWHVGRSLMLFWRLRRDREGCRVPSYFSLRGTFILTFPMSLRLAWKNDPTRWRVGMPAVLLLAAWTLLPGPIQAADWKHDIDFTKLQSILGGSIPNGAGVPISLVEAGGINSIYFPNTNNPNFNAADDPLGTAVNFIDGSGGQANGNSIHAGNQAAIFFGNTSSIAPAANEVTVYEAGDYLSNVLNRQNGRDPIPQDFRVQNFSWISTSGNANQDRNALRRFDFVIGRDNITAVVGVNNNGKITEPNASLPNATQAHPPLLSQSYNAIAVGRSDAYHSRGLTTVASYGPGRSKPSLVAPRTTASAATSSVSSAATLLHSAVAGTDAAQSPAMRAILMAGATKEEFVAFTDPATGLLDPWERTPSQPLDNLFGAGELNVFNSWLITYGGQNAGSTTTPTMAVDASGWDYQTANPGADVEYLFEIPAGTTAQELSIILSWNYEVTDTNASPNIFSPSELLANLDLELVDAMGATVDLSISTIDNVEHLYLTDLGPGSYTLRVSTDVAQDFGIAWRTETLFDVPSADFDGDGDVDGADFFAWQRGFGTLLGATRANGDANGDGAVDAEDLLIFNSGFGVPPPELGGLAASVPEPGAWMLAAIGTLLAIFWRRPRGFACVPLRCQ